MTSDHSQMTCTSEGRWWKEALVLVGVSVPFLFWGIGSISFLDPDEGMYGAIASEMAEGGDWITPYFNGVRHLHKPPLQFWLSALTVTAFGPSEWAVRLWSALPALATALLVWRIGATVYGSAAGFYAAIVFLTNVGIFVYSRVAMADWLLVFSITLSIYGFIGAALSQRSIANGQQSGGAKTNDQLRLPIYLLVFWLGMALGVLSKGLIGLGFPVLIVGIFLLVSSKWKMADSKSQIANSAFTHFYPLFVNRYSLIGLLIFLALVLPWHILAALRNPGFFGFYILDNQILRFLNTRGFIEDDVQNGTISFLVVTLIWFFPWSLFLPVALRQGFPRFRRQIPLNETLRLLVGIWAVGILAFFSLSLSKLEYYSLPAIPALSLMVGGQWAEALTSVKSQMGLKLWLGVLALGCVLFGGAISFFGDGLTRQALLDGFAEINGYYRILKDQGLPFPFDSLSPFVEHIKGVGAVVALGFPISYFFFSWRLPKVSFTVLVTVAGAIAFLVFRLNFVLEQHHSTKPVAKVLLALSEPDDVVVHEGSLEYSGGLPFYTGRQIYVLNGRRGDLDFGSRYPEARHLFMDNGGFIDLWEGNQRVFLVTGYRVRKSIVEHLRSDKLVLLGRYGSRSLYVNQQIAIGKRHTASGN